MSEIPQAVQMKHAGFMAVGTDSGRERCCQLNDDLIHFVEKKIKVLSYQPGGKEVTGHDIAYVSGQTDILNQLRSLLTWQASQKKAHDNGIAIRQPEDRQP